MFLGQEIVKCSFYTTFSSVSGRSFRKIKDHENIQEWETTIQQLDQGYETWGLYHWLFSVKPNSTAGSLKVSMWELL